jgi:hypothetical protein
LLSYLQKSQKCKYIDFELVKKISANLQRIMELSTQKIVIQLSKRHRIPDPGTGSATLRKSIKEEQRSNYREGVHVCDATLVDRLWLMSTASCFQGYRSTV